MAKHQDNPTVTTNGTYLLGYVHKQRALTEWFGLFYGYGTFGGGTIAWKWSPDGGSTLLDINDLSGNPVTSTANDSFTSDFATGAHNNDQIKLYAVLSGATTPSLTIGYYDNN